MARKKIALESEVVHQLSNKDYRRLDQHPAMGVNYVTRYRRLVEMYAAGERVIGVRDLRDRVFGTRKYTTEQLQAELLGMADAGLVEYRLEGLEAVRITLKDVETKIAERLSFITPAHKKPAVLTSFLAYFNRCHYDVTGCDMKHLASNKMLASKVLEQLGGLEAGKQYVDKFFGTPAEQLPGYNFNDFYNYLPEILKAEVMWKQIKRDMKAYENSLKKRREAPPMTPEEEQIALEKALARFKPTVKKAPRADD